VQQFDFNFKTYFGHIAISKLNVDPVSNRLSGPPIAKGDAVVQENTKHPK
jgi:hypothetical protein